MIIEHHGSPASGRGEQAVLDVLVVVEVALLEPAEAVEHGARRRHGRSRRDLQLTRA